MKQNKKTLKQKLDMHFGVKIAEGSKSVKAINSDERTIEAIGNTYFFIDSDMDMLVTGCAVKSINDRGPQSNATAKIKFQSDHILNTKNSMGRMDVLEEREIDGNMVLYFEAHIPETRKGNDDLINYQENIYDNHSIGFRYKVIEMAIKDSTNESERKLWDEFYPKAINPEVADKLGFFWVVKEIELFEISVVSYGANELTPYLGSKSKGDNDKLKIEIVERLSSLNAQLKSTAESKDERKTIDLEFLQLKQIISDLKLEQPSKKGTETPPKIDTTEAESKQLINQLSKQF